MDREARRAAARRGLRRGDRPSSAPRRCLRASLGRLFSSVGLFGLVVCYCSLGALIFQFLEEEFEMDQRKAVERHRDDCIRELWHITERLNVLYEKNWTLLVSERLRLFETSVMTATKAVGYDGSVSTDDRRQWSYGGALLYSVALITTVGFGKLAPKTAAGKMVTMLYAVMGVPLMLLCLAYLGTLVAHRLQLGYSVFCYTTLSSKIICPPKEEIDSKSRSALIPSLVEGELQEDFEESAEGNSIEEYSIEDLAKPDSNISPSRNVAAGNVIQSFARSSNSVIGHVQLECTKFTMAQENVSTVVKIDVVGDTRDSLELQLVENFHQLEEAETLENSEKQRTANQCDSCDEVANGSPEDANISREWTSQHSGTPSRIPLIGKEQLQACPQKPLAETKHIWTATVPRRPPTPIPNKDGYKKKERWSIYAQDSSLPTESDRHLSSTSSLTADQLSPKTPEHHVPVWLVLGVLCAYICIGGATFATWEDWTFLDGVYFCFVILSTIGFGDIVPGKPIRVEKFIQPSAAGVSETLTSHSSLLTPSPDLPGEVEQQLRLVARSVYLFLGLVLIASSISLVQEEVVAFHHALRVYLGINVDESSVAEENEEMDESHEPLRELSFS